MIKTIKSRVSKGIAIASLSALSLPSSAAIPGADYVNLGLIMLSNAYSAIQSDERIEVIKAAMDQVGQIASIKIDSQNNQWANVIVRQNQAKADVQNKEVLMLSTPAANACAPIVISATIDLIDCNQSVEVLSAKAENAKYRSGSSGANTGVNVNTQGSNGDSGLNSGTGSIKGQAERNMRLRMDDLVERAIENRPDLFGRDSDVLFDDIDPEIQRLNPTDPYYLMSSNGDALTISKLDKINLDDFIMLVSPPAVDREIDLIRAGEKNSYRIKMEREKNEANLSNLNFNYLASMRVSLDDEMPSELSLLQEMSDSQFGTGEDYENSVAGIISTSSLMTPSAITRNAAVIRAFKYHISLLNLKASLRREALFAQMLINKIK